MLFLKQSVGKQLVKREIFADVQVTHKQPYGRPVIFIHCAKKNDITC